MSHAEVRTIFFGLMLAAFLAALNQTIIATALPTIGRQFADFENLSWVVTAYLLTSTAVAPLYGKLSDIHGRRAMLLAAVGLFVAGSVLCAAAPNMLLLILGRGLQGLGGGGILPLCQSVHRRRGRPARARPLSGLYGRGVGDVGRVRAGAGRRARRVLALVADLLDQRAARTRCRAPDPPPSQRIPRHERKHKLDLLGAALMMGVRHSAPARAHLGRHAIFLGSPEIFGLLAASFVLSLAFGWRLTRAPEPFLPLTVLNNPVMRWGTTSASLSMGVRSALPSSCRFTLRSCTSSRRPNPASR